MSEEEARRTIELDDFLVVRPALTDIYAKRDVVYPNQRPLGETHAYNSQLGEPMSLQEIRDYLREHALLPESGVPPAPKVTADESTVVAYSARKRRVGDGQ
jgi:hypothetical protein